MVKRLRIPIVTLLVSATLVLASAAPAQGGPPAYQVTGVETSDGVWLATDVFLPEVPEGTKLPTVLVRTPYGRAQFRGGELVVSALVERGFAVVTQDVRGKYSSTGEFLPFVHEQDDGVETLDWIVAQPWSNGRVGMWGSSYLGYSGLVLLPTRHEALETVLHLSGWLDGHEISVPGGARHLMLVLPWLLTQEAERQRHTADLDFEALFRHLPLGTVFESVGLTSRAWVDPTIIQPPPHDFLEEPPKASVLHLTGWYDFVAGGAIAVHQELVAAGFERQRLVVGPWQHNQFYTGDTAVGDEDFGPESGFGPEAVNQLAVTWFERELKGIAPADGEPAPAEIFVMGANEWRRYREWPPRGTVPLRLALARDSGGEGRLERESEAGPRREPLRDRLPVDPNDPVPTWGGAVFHFFGDVSGVRDQREIEARPDVLTYTTEPLAAPLELLGPVRVKARLSTEGRDADLAAKLVVVRPDGYAKIVTEGIVRASGRVGGEAWEPFAPGEILELEVSLGHTALRVAPGERIRLELAGTNFPKYDRNPNSGTAPLLAEELMAVSHTIHSEASQLSFLELTVAEPVGDPFATEGSASASQGGF